MILGRCAAAFIMLAMAGASPAAAQAGSAPTTITLSAAERAALAPVQRAIGAKDWAAAKAALPAALAAVRTPGARFAIGRFRLEIGLGAGDVALQALGLDDLIASGQVPAADLPAIHRNRAVLASNAGDRAKAEANFAKVVELSPNDPEALISLARVRNEMGRPKQAVEAIERAIELKRRAGQSVDESWYKYALNLAYEGRSDAALRDASRRLGKQLVAAYPTKENKRDSLIIFRGTSTLDDASTLDLLRLQRASGALSGERDWLELIYGLYKAGNYGEARAVFQDGSAKRMIDPRKAVFADVDRLITARLNGDLASLPAEEARAKASPGGALALRIAEAWSGHGQHGKAIPLYRLALARGGVDPDLVKTRLAIALLASGDRGGAEATFRTVNGPRRELADLWLAWVATPR